MSGLMWDLGPTDVRGTRQWQSKYRSDIKFVDFCFMSYFKMYNNEFLDCMLLVFFDLDQMKSYLTSVEIYLITFYNFLDTCRDAQLWQLA